MRCKMLQSWNLIHHASINYNLLLPPVLEGGGNLSTIPFSGIHTYIFDSRKRNLYLFCSEKIDFHFSMIFILQTTKIINYGCFVNFVCENWNLNHYQLRPVRICRHLNCPLITFLELFSGGWWFIGLNNFLCVFPLCSGITVRMCKDC